VKRSWVGVGRGGGGGVEEVVGGYGVWAQKGHARWDMNREVAEHRLQEAPGSSEPSLMGKRVCNSLEPLFLSAYLWCMHLHECTFTSALWAIIELHARWDMNRDVARHQLQAAPGSNGSSLMGKGVLPGINPPF
jgi:hypothetical protein